MYCGSCMRDNTLAATLLDAGHDITLIPTFTPIRTDERDVSTNRVFLGGITLYLEQRWPLLRRLPGFVRHGLDSPRLLRWVSSLALQRRGDSDGQLALALLRGQDDCHRAELEDLARWIADDLAADVVNLTNLLIAGFVPMLKARREVKVFATLQGDDIFLDTLTDADRRQVIAEMRRLARSLDGFIVFSRYYRDHMAEMLDLPVDRFHIVPMGLARPERFAPPGDRPRRPGPVVGYLARICPEKGFHQLVDAFIRLRRMPGMEAATLRAAGWLSPAEQPFFEAQRRRLQDAGLGDAFEHIDVPDLEAKIAFLHGLDLLSVPTVYREPKGIFVLEALAAGVPVVVPDHGAFPELLEATGGGQLVPPNDPERLAVELHRLLRDDARRQALAETGRSRVCESLHAGEMARRTLDVWIGRDRNPEAGV